MTEQKISYLYTAHASTGAAYQTEINAWLDSIAAVTNWSRTYSGLKDSNNAVLAIMTHTSGAQLAVWVHATAAPFTSPYNSNVSASVGFDDRIYVSIKPANVSGSFDTTSDPKTNDDFVSDAGALKFHQFSDSLDVNLANRRITVVTDDTDAWMLVEYQEVTGAPGTPVAAHIISFDYNGLLTSDSVYSYNTYSECFMLTWNGAKLDATNLQEAQAINYNGDIITIAHSGVLYDGLISVNEDYINDTYNPGADWFVVPIVIAVLGETIGAIDETKTCFTNPNGPSNKSKINSGDLQHVTDGLCFYWENAWVVE